MKTATFMLAGIGLLQACSRGQVSPPATGNESGMLEPPRTGGPYLDLSRIHDLRDLDQTPSATLTLPPVYPDQLRPLGIEGWVDVAFVLDGSGNVHQVRATASSHPGFEAVAQAAAAKWKYKPGRIEGKSVATRMSVRLTFNPSNEKSLQPPSSSPARPLPPLAGRCWGKTR